MDLKRFESEYPKQMSAYNQRLLLSPIVPEMAQMLLYPDLNSGKT